MELQKVGRRYLIDNHGTDKQKTSSKLSVSMWKAIEVEAARWYETFEITKEGRNVVYILGKKLEAPKVKIDGRSNNKGNGKTNLMVDPLMSLLVYEMIEREYFEEDCFHFSISKIFSVFGITNSRFAFKYSKNNMKIITNELEEHGVEREISYEVLESLHSSFCGAVFSSLKNLEERYKIAKWDKIPYAAYIVWEEAIKTDEHGNLQIIKKKKGLEHRDLPKAISSEIVKRENELLKEMSLTNWQVESFPYAYEVKQFKKKRTLMYLEYNIAFKYDAYWAYLTELEEVIRERIYVPVNREEAQSTFAEIARKYSFNLIDGRQSKIQDGQDIEYFGEFGNVIKDNKRLGTYANKAKKTYGYAVEGKELKAAER